MERLSHYLKPGHFVDSDHKMVIDYTKTNSCNKRDKKGKAVQLYYAIRDGFEYDPYKVDLREESMKASSLLKRDYGYCIEKASLLAACCRVIGIPSRLGFANVRNHIGTKKLELSLKTNVLIFHGYTELHIHGKWVKATPAFNLELCELLNVAPLEFDGINDSVFQQYNNHGTLFMEYLHDHGHFADIPRELFISALQENYPHLFEKDEEETDQPRFRLS